MINKSKSSVLIKHVIRSYSRLSESTRVRSILKENLLSVLNEKIFQDTLDETSKRWLANIFKNLGVSSVTISLNSQGEKK